MVHLILEIVNLRRSYPCEWIDGGVDRGVVVPVGGLEGIVVHQVVVGVGKTPGTGSSINTLRKSDSQRCPTEKRRITTLMITEDSSILPIKIAKSIWRLPHQPTRSIM